jgi:hypothetical protein
MSLDIIGLFGSDNRQESLVMKAEEVEEKNNVAMKSESEDEEEEQDPEFQWVITRLASDEDKIPKKGWKYVKSEDGEGNKRGQKLMSNERGGICTLGIDVGAERSRLGLWLAGRNERPEVTMAAEWLL